MAGGVGSRFWPSSTEEKPKQFLDILGTGQSLIQTTYTRACDIVDPSHIYVLSNERYLDLIQTDLPLLPRENIILEPSRNNTAPTIALASLIIQQKNPDARLVVMPSDHIILNNQAFVDAIVKGVDFVANCESILTLGMEPHRPDTGYGYIKLGPEKEDGIHRVDRFTEKPDITRAQQFLDDGSYVWNAGIFLFSVATILSEFKKYTPEILSVLESDVYGTEEQDAFIKKNYPQTPSVSIDYAIMEKSTLIYSMPINIGWSDLGTWNSLHDYLTEKSSENTVLNNQKMVYLEETEGNIISSPEGKRVVIKGLQNYIIIDEDGVLLVWPRNDEQGIKELRNKLK